jgi:acyl carrier protein
VTEPTAVAVREVLRRIAPDVAATTVDGRADLLQVLGLDSMDFLALIQGIEDRTGVAIPDRDYPLVLTVDALVAYVDAHRSRP